MKIGLLTMPQRSNYGGLLQAYALQTILERMGNDVEIIQRDYSPKPQSLKDKVIKFLLPFIYALQHKPYPVLSQKERDVVSKNTDVFSCRYLHRSQLLLSTTALQQYCEVQDFEGYVVGSDQVWRPRYCPSISDYFLKFTASKDVKRVAYATSFGVDKWEYTPKETTLCRQLIKEFNAVSVREDSGVVLCHEHLGVVAKHVLDPTMLLGVEDYKKIVKDNACLPSMGQLFYYLLDENSEKNTILHMASTMTGYKPFACMPQKAYKGQVVNCPEKYAYKSPAQWIRSFMDAEMVLTDSFHGTVFSIIFNKPFWVIGNPRRGNTRMESLLRLFNLEYRMIDTNNLSNVEWNGQIDWISVNSLLKEWKEESLIFLTEALK